MVSRTVSVELSIHSPVMNIGIMYMILNIWPRMISKAVIEEKTIDAIGLL